MQPDTKLQFVGSPGQFVMGVPARDLTEEDIAALGPDVREFLKQHLESNQPLYVDVAPKARRAKRKGEQEGES